MKTESIAASLLKMTFLTLILMGSFKLFADSIPGVPVCNQTGAPEWCWAAATQSICKYYDKAFTKTLQEVASVYTTDPMVCPPLSSISTQIPKIVETNGKNVKLKATFISGGITEQQAKTEIDDLRPFIFMIQWGGGNVYHCNVVCGYNGSNFLFMRPESRTKSYRSWSTMNGGNIDGQSGSWLATVLTKKEGTGIDVDLTNRMNAPQFKIVCASNHHRGTLVSLSFANIPGNGSTVKFYNTLGSCVYQLNLSSTGAQSAVSVPFTFSSGSYVAQIGQQTVSGFTATDTRSFTILK